MPAYNDNWLLDSLNEREEERKKRAEDRRRRSLLYEENRPSDFQKRLQEEKDKQAREVAERQARATQMQETAQAGEPMRRMKIAMEEQVRQQMAHREAIREQRSRKKQIGAGKDIAGRLGKGYRAFSDAVAQNQAQVPNIQGMGLGGAGGQGLPQVPQQNPWTAGLRGAGVMGTPGSLGGVAGGMSNPAFATTNPGLANLPTGAGGSVASGVGYGIKGLLQAEQARQWKLQELKEKNITPRNPNAGDYLVSGVTGGAYPEDAAPYGPGSMGSFATAFLDPLWSLFGESGQNAKSGVSNAIAHGAGIPFGFFNPFDLYKNWFT